MKAEAQAPEATFSHDSILNGTRLRISLSSIADGGEGRGEEAFLKTHVSHDLPFGYQYYTMPSIFGSLAAISELQIRMAFRYALSWQCRRSAPHSAFRTPRIFIETPWAPPPVPPPASGMPE